MVITIDCGNTLIKVALYEGKELVSKFALTTDRGKSVDEYAYLFKNILPNGNNITGAIISSVVPEITTNLTFVLSKLFNITPLILDKDIKSKMSIKIDNPSELGADMLSGAVAAKEKYGFGTIVADLGTATKLYVVDKNGSFIGGVIFSGMKVSLKSLVNNTSLLMETNLTLPKKVIGKNTKDCLQSGIVYSQIFSIRSFANEFEKQLGYPLNRVLTGGYGEIIKDELNEFTFEKNLVSDGLINIYYINQNV